MISSYSPTNVSNQSKPNISTHHLVLWQLMSDNCSPGQLTQEDSHLGQLPLVYSHLGQLPSGQFQLRTIAASRKLASGQLPLQIPTCSVASR